MMTTSSSPASSAPPANPSVPQPPFSTLADIEAAQRAIQEQLAALERAREQIADTETQAVHAKIDAFKAELGVKTDAEAIMIIRNRGLKSQKAKRLPQATLEQMKWVLANGATAPETAKFFKVSLATVHARKAEWKLTHRGTKVKQKPIREALKGYKPKAATP